MKISKQIILIVIPISLNDSDYLSSVFYLEPSSLQFQLAGYVGEWHYTWDCVGDIFFVNCIFSVRSTVTYNFAWFYLRLGILDGLTSHNQIREIIWMNLSSANTETIKNCQN